ncbi:zinc-binding protein A33 isoform X1 [Esox lucius]|uniref:zinc-binding protein A33 isoform X1 n=3 Tax=Esox lucius TaxID=8010 RepID=UPI0010BE08F4|nr:zinc-binding protein A33 isoform X1 [Esox lucius]
MSSRVTKSVLEFKHLYFCLPLTLKMTEMTVSSQDMDSSNSDMSKALNQAPAQAPMIQQDTAPALAIARYDYVPVHIWKKIFVLGLGLFFVALLYSLCFKAQSLKIEENKELKKVKVTATPGDEIQKDFNEIQQNAVNVTLDPDTAHPSLIVSEDGKQVRNGHTRQKLPDNPERIDPVVSVLGKEGFSSGRFYYEVQVMKKTEWSLGVARQSIKRKGILYLKPVNGFWAFWLRNGQYKACNDPDVFLSLTQKLQKVGVFVDYEEGQVSFYDAEARSLIYSFNGQNFTEKLYPYFSPSRTYGGNNSAPLIILPFSQ